MEKNSVLNICELNTKGIDFVQDNNAFYALLDYFFAPNFDKNPNIQPRSNGNI